MDDQKQCVSPPSGPDEGPKKKRAKNRKITLWTLVLLLALAAWPGYNACFHLRGRAAYDAGDYPQAIELLKKDRLFSGSLLREAIREAGLASLAKGDFTAAIGWFSQLEEDGILLRAEALCEQMLQNNTPENLPDHILTLEALEAEASTREIALNTRETLCYRLGLEALDGHPAEAALYFRQCRTQEEALFYNAIADGIEAGLYRETVDRILSRDGGAPENYRLFYEYCAAVSCQTPDQRLAACREGLRLGPQVQTTRQLETLLAELDYFTGREVCCNASERVGTQNFPISDLQALYALCAANPEGKVLILCREKVFEGADIFYIPMDLMACLPQSLFPGSLSEAEYIITLSLDHRITGEYRNVTKAVQQTGFVQLVHMPGNQLLYKGQNVKGPDAPASFPYTGEAPACRSGGAPELSPFLVEAIKELWK